MDFFFIKFCRLIVRSIAGLFFRPTILWFFHLYLLSYSLSIDRMYEKEKTNFTNRNKCQFIQFFFPCFRWNQSGAYKMNTQRESASKRKRNNINITSTIYTKLSPFGCSFTETCVNNGRNGIQILSYLKIWIRISLLCIYYAFQLGCCFGLLRAPFCMHVIVIEPSSVNVFFSFKFLVVCVSSSSYWTGLCLLLLLVSRAFVRIKHLIRGSEFKIFMFVVHTCKTLENMLENVVVFLFFFCLCRPSFDSMFAWMDSWASSWLCK